MNKRLQDFFSSWQLKRDLLNLANRPIPPHPQDVVDVACGSISTAPNIGKLDMTRCTIAHELGHVLVARAGGSTATAINYPEQKDDSNVQVFCPPSTTCGPGQTGFDPGKYVSGTPETGWT